MFAVISAALLLFALPAFAATQTSSATQGNKQPETSAPVLNVMHPASTACASA